MTRPFHLCPNPTFSKPIQQGHELLHQDPRLGAVLLNNSYNHDLDD